LHSKLISFIFALKLTVFHSFCAKFKQKYMKIELNQEVFLVGIGNIARYNTPTYNATVSKIGRKWFYLEVPEAFYIGRDHKFSLEDGLCDGKGYMPEWQVYESEQNYKEEKEMPIIRKEIIDNLNLSYNDLVKVLIFIKEL